MSQERKMILEMLANGKITVEEAEKLLSVINERSSTEERKVAKGTYYPKIGKTLYIQVTKDDQKVVNVAFPVMTLKILSKTGKLRLFMDDKINLGVGKDLTNQINFDELMEMIDKNQVGDILNVKSDSGEVVRIFIK